MLWVSTGFSLINLDSVVLLLVPDLAAPRSRPVQSGVVDLHAGYGAIALVFVPRYGVPLRHTDLFEREEGLHRSADGTYAQVLLLGGESEGEERNHTEGIRFERLSIYCFGSYLCSF